VLNSTSPVDNYAYNTSDIAVLQSENERLKGLLMQYQQQAAKPGAIGLAAMQENSAVNEAGVYTVKKERRSGARWSGSGSFGGLKPVVMGLILLFSCLALFAGFSMYNSRKSAAVVIDTAAINAEKARLKDSILALERLNAKRMQDSIDNARRYNAIKQKILAVQQEEDAKQQEETDRASEKEEKKKRKRFFDIRFEKGN
jgi:ribosomal protein L12E/L44/L45/RPP1/RPP2